jgi:FkbM family methyltransferase
MPHLAGDGHEVAVSAFYGLSGASIPWEGYRIYPAGLEPYGVDVIAGHAASFKADLVLTLMDFWQMRPAAQELRTLRTAAWLPTDCDPLGELDRMALEMSGAVPLVMSRFAYGTVEAAGLNPIYVPHSVDTQVYRPDPMRGEMRKALGLASRFAVGICAANSDGIRKGWPEQLQAFAQFHQRHEDSVLLIHSVAGNKNGLPLAKMVEVLGLDGAVLWSDQYAQVAGEMDDATMAGWFSCLDVLLGCSYAEAFGIPLIEAQACGTPVITTNGSAMAELSGPGWTVNGEPFYNPVHHANWVRPSIPGIVRALERAYSTSDTMATRRRTAAVRFAAEFDRFRVFEDYWRPALATLEGLTPEPLVMDYDGLRWKMGDFRNRCGDLLALNHESDLGPVIRGLFPVGGVFLDIGAHVGHWAVRLADQASRVVAVEVDPATAERLRENIALNAFGDRVEVLQLAAWDSHRDLIMFSPNGYEHDGSNQVRAEGTGQTVRGVPLDSVEALKDLDRLDLVKIDVEGADLHVLRGMRDILTTFRPVLFVEDHSVYGMYERADLDDLLSELGYDWEDLELYRGYLIARPRA